MNADPHAIRDLAALRRVYKPPMGGAVRKVMPALDKHARAYLAASPFAVIATANADGVLDASPKGGPPGFIVPEDDRTLLIPDWPGNNRLDGFENILANPRVGILAFLPGMNEMLRINGRAALTVDPARRARLTTAGKLPISVMVVTVEEVYLHCARALQRSALWDASRHIDRKSFPSMGTMLADQIAGYDGAATDRLIAAAQDQLYGSV
jgi:PPOX class probable FMN-dependent enzyme